MQSVLVTGATCFPGGAVTEVQRDMGAGFEKWFGLCDPARVGAAIKVYTAFATLNIIFDNRRLLTEGFPPPASFVEYVARCVTTAEQATIAGQMEREARDPLLVSEAADAEDPCVRPSQP